MTQDKIRDFQSMADHADNEAQKRYYEAKVAKLKGEYTKAAELFVEQTKLYADAVHFQSAGECFYLQKKYYEAIVYLAAAVGLNEKRQRALYLLAAAQYESGNPDRAVTTLRRLISIDPKDKKSHALLEKIFADRPDLKNSF